MCVCVCVCASLCVCVCGSDLPHYKKYIMTQLHTSASSSFVFPGISLGFTIFWCDFCVYDRLFMCVCVCVCVLARARVCVCVCAHVVVCLCECV